MDKGGILDSAAQNIAAKAAATEGAGASKGHGEWRDMRHRQRGFSLIEAMVALVILAGASLALFGWLSTSLNQLNRAALYTQAAPALQSVGGYLQMQDLNEQPAGTFSFGKVNIDWQASAVEANDNASSGQTSSNFLLSLFDVELLPTVQGRPLPALHTRVVNYRLKPGAGQNPFD